ncbi:MAG TPA: phospho-sugar mutase [Streptosporangiaceae bacterium]|nr:phospho-sugar mutase [Streptosporangiaceae bacterium]
MTGDDLRAAAERWLAGDPDERDRAELRRLLDDGTSAAAAELADRFRGRLTFGTAGLRGAVGAGPNRMNRAVVRAATAALAGWLAGHLPGAAAAGVVIGCDARHRSDEFAAEAARVLAGAGIAVHLLPARQPTPLLAFAIRQLGAAAGVMITASHNPPADNGYKLYLGDGAQIIPPVDAQIEAAIAGLGPLSAVPAAAPGSPLITRHGDEVAEAYLAAIVAAAPGLPLMAGPPLRVVYTPLHGVAAGLALRAFRRAGFPPPHLVAGQAEPDPDFPTVAFPNPEEPGALDLALADARGLGADLVIANDPDGDRLAVAVPDPAAPGGWRALTGDQVGALLGAYLLDKTAARPGPGHRLVATTVVSSTMLSKIAAAAGAGYAETLTGFKWIVRAGDSAPGSRFVFGYEEALGYAVGDVVRDKDGISAALALLSLAADARRAGQSLLDRWDALEAAHGVHLTAQVTLPAEAPGQIMAGLRAAPPAALAGQPVTGIGDLSAGAGGLPPSDLLSYLLPGARVVIRPSGTEPKLKAYLEVTEPAAGRTLAAARAAAAGRLGPLRAAVTDLVAAGAARAAGAAGTAGTAAPGTAG